MLENYTILCDSNIPWHLNRYSKHHIMSRLARRNRVLFVNPRIDIGEYFGGSPRKFIDLFRRKQHPTGEALVAYTPLAPPFRSRLDLACAIDPILFSWQLKRLVHATNPDRLILFLGNPWNGFLLDSFEGYACALYHCSDNFPAFFTGGFAERIKAREEILIRRSDVVVSTSDQLYAKCRPLNSNSHLIPHGVDECFFRASSRKEEPLDDLETGGVPLIGYIGSIDRLLDFELLEYTLSSLKDCCFIFIGPVADDVKDKFATISAHGNCRYLGRKKWHELPAYLSRFNACIIPWMQSEFVQGGCPLKLVEYLAAGKPTVATRIAFDEKLSPGVTVTGDAASFVHAIVTAVETDKDRTLGPRLQRLVRDWGWDAKVEEYCGCIEDVIRQKMLSKKEGRRDPAELPGGNPLS
jgi:glycosyltransferase involved in cell wall biosynthesis